MNSILQNLLTNWKTTSTGLTMIVGSAIHLIFAVRAGTDTESTWTIAFTAIVGGLGLMFAGDSNKSASKQDVHAITQQIAEVPAAIDSGDTRFLSKTINDNKPETKTP